MDYTLEIDGQTHHLTTDHAASHYRIPVLVGPDGAVVAPGDVGCLRIGQAKDSCLRELTRRGYAWIDVRMHRSN